MISQGTSNNSVAISPFSLGGAGIEERESRGDRLIAPGWSPLLAPYPRGPHPNAGKPAPTSVTVW